MTSLRSKLAWKLVGASMALCAAFHAALAVFLWGYSKELLLQLSMAVPGIAPAQIHEFAARLGMTAIAASVPVLLLSGAVAFFCALRVAELPQSQDRSTPADESRRLGVLSGGAAAPSAEQRSGERSRHDRERAAIFASMVEGVIAVDHEKTIIEINPAACALCELTGSTGLGAALGAVLPMPEVAALIERVSSGDSTGSSLVVGLQRHPDRTPRVLEVQATPLHDGERRRTGTVLVLHDVTELRRLERIRQDFVANVSHELRTPITSIQGFVETLLEGALGDPRVSRRFVEIIRKHAERLRTLIDDLMMLARVEEREECGTLQRDQVPVADLLRSVAEWCQPLARDKHLVFSVECLTEVQVRINRSLFEQALVNLAQNAIKFTEPGGEVKVIARLHGDDVRFEVCDTGIGIGKEHLPRVFERFYRADRSRSRQDGGTGLGLAIVKHIVRAHGGDIDVESQIGKGSTFILRVPEHVEGLTDIEDPPARRRAVNAV